MTDTSVAEYLHERSLFLINLALPSIVFLCYSHRYDDNRISPTLYASLMTAQKIVAISIVQCKCNIYQVGINNLIISLILILLLSIPRSESEI